MVAPKMFIIRSVSLYGLVFCVFFFLNRLGWHESFNQHGRQFFAPIRQATLIAGAQVKNVGTYLLVPWKQAAELRSVRIQYISLLAEYEDVEQLKQENESLRKIVGLPERQRTERQLASIHSYTFPSVASGQQEGVRVGMSVISDTTLVGIITETKEHHSLVQLITQRPSDEPVLVQTESGVMGLLVAQTGSLYLEQLPLTAVVTEGERISTVGQEDIAPRKSIGIIKKISQDVRKGTQRAEILQPSTFYSSAVVYLE